MVPRQQVIDYITSSMRSGFDASSIRSRLLSSGYDPSEVNAAFDALRRGPSQSSSRHIGTLTLVAIAMIAFLFIGGVATVFLHSSSSPASTNEATFEPTKTPTTGTGSSTGTTTGSTTTGTGKTTTGTSGGKTTTKPATSTTDFASDRPIPNVDRTTDSAPLATRLAIENRVSELSASRPDDAAALCGQITTTAGQQSCLNTVAQNSEQSRFCTMISDDESADACLTSLAIKQVEDVNLCKKMKGEIRFRQCVALYDSNAQLDLIQKSAADVQTPALSEPSTDDLQDAYTQELTVVTPTQPENTQPDATVTDTTPDQQTQPDATVDAPVDQPEITD